MYNINRDELFIPLDDFDSIVYEGEIVVPEFGIGDGMEMKCYGDNPVEVSVEIDGYYV